MQTIIHPLFFVSKPQWFTRNYYYFSPIVGDCYKTSSNVNHVFNNLAVCRWMGSQRHFYWCTRCTFRLLFLINCFGEAHLEAINRRREIKLMMVTCWHSINHVWKISTFVLTGNSDGRAGPGDGKNGHRAPAFYDK